MFRGLDHQELRVVLALIAMAFGALILNNNHSDFSSAPRVQVQGVAAVHSRGELVPESTPPKPVEPSATEAVTPAFTLAAPTMAPRAGLPAAASPFAAGGRVDLNRAGAAELELLPGIGPAKAQAILEDRARHGPFRSVAELDRVPGFGEKTVARLAPFLAVEGATAGAVAPGAGRQAPVASAAPVRINFASAEELETLTGVGPKMAARILQERALRGGFRSEGDLGRVPGIGPVFLQKNRARIRYD